MLLHAPGIAIHPTQPVPHRAPTGGIEVEGPRCRRGQRRARVGFQLGGEGGRLDG